MTTSTGPDTGADVALLVASAMVPGTFSRSLSRRTAVDQGLVTGLSAGLHYLLTVGTQDILQAAAVALADGRPARRDRQRWTRQQTVLLAADLAAIPLGMALRRAVRPMPGEPIGRGVLPKPGGASPPPAWVARS